jgi:hypothetical protein
MLGMRLNEYRNSFSMPDGITCPNLEAEDSDSMEGGNRRLEYGKFFSSSSGSTMILNRNRGQPRLGKCNPMGESEYQATDLDQGLYVFYFISNQHSMSVLC